MDRYPDMDAYAAAKARIFGDDGVQVLNRDDARSLAMALPGRHVVSFGLDRSPKNENFGFCEDELCLGGDMLMPLSALPVAGLHNAANALAALALTRALGLPMDAAAARPGALQGSAASGGKSRRNRGRDLLRRFQGDQRWRDRSCALRHGRQEGRW